MNVGCENVPITLEMNTGAQIYDKISTDAAISCKELHPVFLNRCFNLSLLTCFVGVQRVVRSRTLKLVGNI
jgi:hypothetical protein